MGFLAKKPAVGAKGGSAAQPGPGRQTSRDRGQQAEELALAHLVAAGLRLVERNYRTPGRGGGEIDLILRDRDGCLIFVEVRSRSGRDYGGAGASIGALKRQRIVFAARHFLLRYGAPPPCRFDVVLVEPAAVLGQSPGLQWLPAAFDAPG
ncbi:YraN family protein [Comamonas composti]|uniref:YraN family protein n=1 Tax=Comamonas composti TaxID=408558 RepID=UPI0004045382|nr:YraN family protein [Comamonas composti]